MLGLDAGQLGSQLVMVGLPDLLTALGNLGVIGMQIGAAVDGGVGKGVDRAQAGNALAGVEAGAIGERFMSTTRRECVATRVEAPISCANAYSSGKCQSVSCTSRASGVKRSASAGGT